MARRPAPPCLSRRMRRSTSGAVRDAEPSRFPFARAAASPSFVRWPIMRRSSCANTTAMFAIASPMGVDVSSWRSSRTSDQPRRRLRSTTSAKSRTLREESVELSDHEHLCGVGVEERERGL